jgi:hypothetical protein
MTKPHIFLAGLWGTTDSATSPLLVEIVTHTGFCAHWRPPAMTPTLAVEPRAANRAPILADPSGIHRAKIGRNFQNRCSR